MVHFKVSAPCRLSLFGELALKYGKTSLIAAMNLRTTLTFYDLSSNYIYLNFRQTNLVQEYVVQFENFYSECTENMESMHKLVLKYTDPWRDTPNHKIIQAFYFLLVLITYNEEIEIKPFTINLSTELMMDDELACSASYTLCIAASLLHWSRLQKGIHDTFDEKDIPKFLEYAICCEEIFTETELNVTACTHGLITKNKMNNISRAEFLPHNIPMPILLVDSKQTQNLEAQMQRIAELNTISPELVSTILNGIDILTHYAFHNFRDLINLYKDINNDMETTRIRILQKQNDLKLCIRTNQNLLNSLNVSHNHVDEICLIAQKHGMCGKYTDIGSGRYAYIWCPRHVGEPCTHMMLISEELKLHGFDVTETNLAQSGMRIEMLLNSQV